MSSGWLVKSSMTNIVSQHERIKADTSRHAVRINEPSSHSPAAPNPQPPPYQHQSHPGSPHTIHPPAHRLSSRTSTKSAFRPKLRSKMGQTSFFQTGDGQKFATADSSKMWRHLFGKACQTKIGPPLPPDLNVAAHQNE